jgi:putative PIN family toxin of toxin-antitoxin system
VKVFLDTNVLISALTTRGLCAELLESVLSQHELLTGEPVLKELHRILREKFRLSDPVVKEYLKLLREQARVVEAPYIPVMKLKDPDDIPILACALAAQVDAFVTGDKELLAIGKVADMPILDPRQFWNVLKGELTG